MSHPTLRIKILRDSATLPAYQSADAAGLDLAACLGADTGTHQVSITIAPSQIVIIPTGLAVAIPPGYEGQVRPRSGLASKHGITLPNAPGTIDADYRGELKVPLINLGREPFVLSHGQRIAQLIIAPVARAAVQIVNDLDETTRGQQGFGSTGTH